MELAVICNATSIETGEKACNCEDDDGRHPKPGFNMPAEGIQIEAFLPELGESFLPQPTIPCDVIRRIRSAKMYGPEIVGPNNDAARSKCPD